MKKEYLLFLVFPISQIMMIAGDFAALKKFGTLGYVGIILSIVADCVLLYVLIYGTKKEKLERELEQVRYLKEIEDERNSIMEKRQNEIFMMKKEFEKQIHKIQQSLDAGDKIQADANMERLQQELDRTKPEVYCKYAIVNAILNEKEKCCKDLGVSIETDLMIPEKLNVEPLHMCSVFSNLLDNAIEAVCELPQKDRNLSVQGEMKGNYLFLQVKNPATKAHAERKRRKNRGYGTKILTDIAEKYDGQYLAEYNKDCYVATIGLKVV